MSSTYFTIPSFARAKKNREDLEKTNPQEPVLKDEDEKFLNSQISSKEAAKQGEEVPATKIADSGEEKKVSTEEQEKVGDSVVVPETQPAESGDGAQDGEAKVDSGDGAQEGESKLESSGDTQEEEQSPDQTNYDDVMKEKAAERVKARKDKKKTGMDLPTQEEAEAATRGFSAQQAEQDAGTSQGEKRTWASYLPSVRPGSGKKPTDATTTTEQPSDTTGTGADPSTDKDGRTWTQYATSYVPTVTLPAIALRRKPKDADAAAEPVYNEDGTINEEATKERQEREVSVLLDNLNLSSINNRVFAFSAETQQIYHRFAQVLKDIINGAPTAYDDMDKLMREAGPKLEQQFSAMPPFVQTLVKSLPMKLGSTLGPELMAAASEKPGGDMKARMETASKPGVGGKGADAGGSLNMGASSSSATTTTETAEDGTQTKKKRTIPGFKSLVSSQSGVAGMLRSAVSFLQTRFPFLASSANVAMSLAVFSKFPYRHRTRADHHFVFVVGGR